MIIIQNLSYIHPNKDLLFENINLTIQSQEKTALIGNNGSGKSTLLKIIAGKITSTSGSLKLDAEPYYMPQIFGQFDHLTIAEALGISNKINGLKEILKGNATEENFSLLNDDWLIEQRCKETFVQWKLDDLDLNQKLESLSGGQKTKVFLAGISITNAEFVLLDEPSNHLDLESRNLLYKFIKSTKKTLLIVSHDRKLLHLLDPVLELNKNGINVYGGNYDFYVQQKQIENNTLQQDIHSKERALKKAKEKERETLERAQKTDARGKGKQEKAGVARIMLNTMKNKAENSTSKLKSIHAEKTSGISRELQDLRSNVKNFDKMKFGFDNSNLHQGKMLFKTENINFTYNSKSVWEDDLDLEIVSGERIIIKGENGSGKTTLINLILGKIKPSKGEIFRSEIQSIYIDQDYSLIQNQFSIYEQAQEFNTEGLQEHDIKIRLSRFLFPKESWDKKCEALSGGERMRLMLCCLTICQKVPDLIVLDEPTNNLDIENIEIMTAAINEYEGTLIVVSHDESFMEQINIIKTIQL
ncbi:ABC-F family ATP-binding cassette domain-containing protein [Moheibacter sediminis]|uniref:ATPase components of ABC transporters with duplicated ATPase domains n=1 Tax=Moheibacter sediminis TaxID=1434700 RepID=A0A1W2AZG8_9FLAO|nr:ABC-F family ATP-binding cassette domain-containing protein [Moheibacter sediminis]SMC65851.1 ATPase components of ABC transporters with duplicated ATPase domains [Moheibacter sediminis]